MTAPARLRIIFTGHRHAFHMACIDTITAGFANPARPVIEKYRIGASRRLAATQGCEPVGMTWLPDLGLRRILRRHKGKQAHAA